VLSPKWYQVGGGSGFDEGFMLIVVIVPCWRVRLCGLSALWVRSW